MLEEQEEDEFIFNEITSSLNDIEVVDHEVVGKGEEQQIQFEFELPLTTPAAETPNLDVAPKVFHLEEESIAASTEEEMEELRPAELALKSGRKRRRASREEPLRPAAHDNPFDQSIRESISKQNEKRKEQLKQFNYTFKNNLNRIEEMERQPAYKRLGFELDAPLRNSLLNFFT